MAKKKTPAPKIKLPPPPLSMGGPMSVSDLQQPYRPGAPRRPRMPLPGAPIASAPPPPPLPSAGMPPPAGPPPSGPLLPGMRQPMGGM